MAPLEEASVPSAPSEDAWDFTGELSPLLVSDFTSATERGRGEEPSAHLHMLPPVTSADATRSASYETMLPSMCSIGSLSYCTDNTREELYIPCPQTCLVLVWGGVTFVKEQSFCRGPVLLSKGPRPPTLLMLITHMQHGRGLGHMVLQRPGCFHCSY